MRRPRHGGHRIDVARSSFKVDMIDDDDDEDDDDETTTTTMQTD